MHLSRAEAFALLPQPGVSSFVLNFVVLKGEIISAALMPLLCTHRHESGCSSSANQFSDDAAITAAHRYVA